MSDESLGLAGLWRFFDFVGKLVCKLYFRLVVSFNSAKAYYIYALDYQFDAEFIAKLPIKSSYIINVVLWHNTMINQSNIRL